MALEQVLADWRERASDARRLGNEAQATAIDAVLDDVTPAAEPFTRWLAEDRAMLYSQKSSRWLRQRFQDWKAQGAAKLEKGKRFYLRIVLPVPVDLDATAADAERTAREDAT